MLTVDFRDFDDVLADSGLIWRLVQRARMAALDLPGHPSGLAGNLQNLEPVRRRRWL